MVVDVICSNRNAGELLQEVILFVGGAVRTENPNRLSAILIANLGESLSDQLKRFFPC